MGRSSTVSEKLITKVSVTNTPTGNDVGIKANGSYSLTGVAVSNSLANGVDLAAPSSWTTVYSRTTGGVVYIGGISGALDYYLQVAVSNTETVGDGIRAQIIRDGITIYDITLISNGTTVGTATSNCILVSDSLINASTAVNAMKIAYDSSFTLRACRVGTFSEATSLFKHGFLCTIDTA